uniref:Uncharacterized protein n=1 Tax=Anguilla anguilla TaxID=7936 RepID=A0A0E9QYJ2_ANGAN
MTQSYSHIRHVVSAIPHLDCYHNSQIWVERYGERQLCHYIQVEL